MKIGLKCHRIAMGLFLASSQNYSHNSSLEFHVMQWIGRLAGYGDVRLTYVRSRLTM